MLGDDKGSGVAMEGKKCASILVLGWFLIKHSLNFLNTLHSNLNIFVSLI